MDVKQSGSLTPEQVLRVAYSHIIEGVDQHKLASLMGVNQGRINEAVKVVEWAANNHKLAYRIVKGKVRFMPVETNIGDQ